MLKIAKGSLSVLTVAALLLSGVLTSCEGADNLAALTTGAAGNTTGGRTTEEDIYKPELPAADYGGAEFIMVTRDDSMHNYPVHTRDLVAEGETGEIINDIVFRRNRRIEDQYNIKLKMVSFVETAGEQLPNEAVERAVKAGDDVYDLLLTHMILGGGQAQRGIYTNWMDVPYVDFTKPYWAQGAVEGLSVGDKLFLINSDMTISTNDNIEIILFNKKLAQEYDIENPYQLVRENKWTFNKLTELAKGAGKDLNGDQIMDDNDQYGILFGGGLQNFMWSGGASITSKDENNRPYLTMMSPRMVEIFDWVYSMVVGAEGEYTHYIVSWIDPLVQTMFAANKALFVTTEIGVIEELRNMETEFGILPYPKLDSSQEDWGHYVAGHAPLMAIPTTVQDLERVGIIVEALSYESYKELRPAYYDVLLNTKYVRDEESSEMLDIIMNSRVYDFGYVYDNWTMAFMFLELVETKNNAFVSYYEKKEPKGIRNLEAILKAYDDLE